MGSANEVKCYIVMSSLIGWPHTQNDLIVKQVQSGLLKWYNAMLLNELDFF